MNLFLIILVDQVVEFLDFYKGGSMFLSLFIRTAFLILILIHSRLVVYVLLQFNIL